MHAQGAFTSVRAAADQLGVSLQTIRNWLHSGKLAGRKGENGRWEVETASVESELAKVGRRQPRSRDGIALPELRRLAQVIEDLQQRIAGWEDRSDALARERDRYRAEATTMQEVAFRLNVAAREVSGTTRQVLVVLEQHQEALAQLLGPGSPQELHDPARGE